MGRFSTTLNIKNNSDREGFLKSFCEMMKKRGFVKCNEDEAAVSYALAFGDGWVTIANEDYKDNIKKAYDERKLISEEMKTAAFTVEVVDSDFAILCLNSDGRTSKIVVGDGEGYGVEKTTFEVDDWKPLIKNGDSEKFLDTVGQDDVFAEETLSVTAEILGIDTYYIDADYDEILEKSDDKNVTVIYFKKVAVKAMSLNTAFKKVFGAALEPLGFRLIKSKYPYFVRIVPGEEIIHVISFRKLQSFDPKYDLIDIVGGVATVYRQRLDLSRSPNNENWFKDNDWIYSHQRPKNSDKNRENYYEFKISTDRQKMLEDMQAACDITCKIMVSMLDKVVNIDACIEFSKELGINLELCDEHYGNDIPGNYYKEGFIYFKTDKNIFRNKMMNAISEIALREKAYFERVQDDPVLYNEVQEELKRRKAQNTEILRSYGVDI